MLHSSNLAGQRVARRGANAFAPVRASAGRLTRVRVYANAAAAAQGTQVPKNVMLVVGATGTLGRQVVRRALDDGYDVRCLVRPRPNPADFLRDWGAKVVNGDLTDPASIPACLVGVHTVVDCATARPEESTRKVDWDGKVALIQSAQDEATSALDGPTEGRLYALIRKRVGCYVSVGHRMQLLQHHTHVLECLGGGQWRFGSSADYQRRMMAIHATFTGMHSAAGSGFPGPPGHQPSLRGGGLNGGTAKAEQGSNLAGQRVARRGANAFAPVRASAGRLTRVRVYANAAAAAQGTQVPKNVMLVVGATGTLGRQVVRRALDDGYDVRCLVRPRPNPADFLRDWGAKVVNGDLTDPASIPACLVGVHTVVDCATARPEESTRKVDWDGKVALIQSAQEYFTRIMKKLKEVGATADRTNFYASQRQLVAGTEADQSSPTNRRIQRVDKASRKSLTLSGPKAWTTREVIELCAKMADTRAQVTTVPTWLLKGTRSVLRSMQWAWDAADRLAFAEVLSNNDVWTSDMAEVYRILELDPNSAVALEDYLQEYFTRIMKKLKEVGATADRTNFYV
ncbi:hypothetical protein TSOC_010380 [Tetrabaena socialis]|uniref:NmrA-like domain-containing protein n=1 Tax=Tetrabaena socialis TaxID=47790 RepID=A0A2J7ZTG1_9CHLO|nr:hypothetical protein TSOC_010380 [Tetrabaena socialis]|eukprot:PNH03567.1 hypothetical protein TSOC_010380 [Tetrabaena socialis]